MKKIIISEEEKLHIKGLHSSYLIYEDDSTTTTTTTQAVNYQLRDIQKILGVNPDNVLGPITLAALEKKLQELPKVEQPKPEVEKAKSEEEKQKQIEVEKSKKETDLKKEYDNLKNNMGYTDDEIKSYLKKYYDPTSVDKLLSVEIKTPESTKQDVVSSTVVDTTTASK